MADQSEIIRNTYAGELRDVADGDYVAARAAWRMGLVKQWASNAAQALEKYLKCASLYRGASVTHLNHELPKAWTTFLNAADFAVERPPWTEWFLEKLNDQAKATRYNEAPYTFYGGELLWHDAVVWHVRRYCQTFGLLGQESPEKVEKAKRAAIRRLHSEHFTKNPHMLRLNQGLLDRILQDPDYSEARRTLVWKNFFFGKRGKRMVSVAHKATSGNPVHVRHPSMFADLKRYARFAGWVKKEMEDEPDP